MAENMVRIFSLPLLRSVLRRRRRPAALCCDSRRNLRGDIREFIPRGFIRVRTPSRQPCTGPAGSLQTPADLLDGDVQTCVEWGSRPACPAWSGGDLASPGESGLICPGGGEFHCELTLSSSQSRTKKNCNLLSFDPLRDGKETENEVETSQNVRSQFLRGGSIDSEFSSEKPNFGIFVVHSV